jgi:hypothetical protein
MTKEGIARHDCPRVQVEGGEQPTSALEPSVEMAAHAFTRSEVDDVVLPERLHPVWVTRRFVPKAPAGYIDEQVLAAETPGHHGVHWLTASGTQGHRGGAELFAPFFACLKLMQQFRVLPIVTGEDLDRSGEVWKQNEIAAALESCSRLDRWEVPSLRSEGGGMPSDHGIEGESDLFEGVRASVEPLLVTRCEETGRQQLRAEYLR